MVFACHNFWHNFVVPDIPQFLGVRGRFAKKGGTTLKKSCATLSRMFSGFQLDWHNNTTFLTLTYARKINI